MIKAYKEWLSVPDNLKQTIFSVIANEKAVGDDAIEKDYLVSLVLNAIFSALRKGFCIQRRHKFEQRMESYSTILRGC